MSTKVKKLVSGIFIGNKIHRIINVKIEFRVIKIIMKISIDEIRPWKFEVHLTQCSYYSLWWGGGYFTTLLVLQTLYRLW